jgi:hypothetical membrane protein
MDIWPNWLLVAVLVPTVLYTVWRRRRLSDLGSANVRTLRWAMDAFIVVGCLLVILIIFEFIYF